MKMVSITGILTRLAGEGTSYPVSTVLSNEIWFVIGMCICIFRVREAKFRKTMAGILLGIAFLILSVLFRNANNSWLAFGLGFMACIVVVLVSMVRERQGRVMSFLSKYTMPIFLMHSIFAATLRSILLKIGITNVVVHISCGVAISIFGPIMAAWVMEKTKYLEFFIYPGKFIIIGNSKEK